MSTQARMPVSGLNHRELEVDEPDAFGGLALRRMPGLAVPFALVAAAAAFFAVFALGSFEPMREASPVWPAIFAVVPGAIAGAIIRRWRALYETFMNRPSRIARIALVVIIAGASIGAVVGISSWGDAGLAPCAVGGAVYALAFIPAALFVQSASSRAARARMGSLVADVDRRSVIVSLLAVVAFAALTQAPALASAQLSFLVNRFVQPALSVAVSVACAVGIHRIRRRDQDARAHFEEVVREAAWLERTVAVDDVEPGVTVDLGLGADRWSRTGELATYRTAPRSELVFCGSLHDARRAIDVALRQSQRALIFAAATTVVTIAAFAFGAVT